MHATMDESFPPAFPCLLVLMGLPAAGKTTLARSLGRTFQEHGCSTSHICFDDLLHDAEGGSIQTFSPERWQETRARALASATASLEDGEGRPHAVIVDDNMWYRSMRHEYCRLARSKRAAYVQLYVACDASRAAARNAARPPAARVPTASIDRIASTLEEPDPEKYLFEACTVTVRTDEGPEQGEDASSSQTAARAAYQAVREYWLLGPAPPLPDKEAIEERRRVSRLTTQSSAVHQIDLHARRGITGMVGAARAAAEQEPGAAGDAAPSTAAEVSSVLARELNEARREVLARARELLSHRGGGGGPEDGQPAAAFDTVWALCTELFDRRALEIGRRLGLRG